MLDFSRRLTAIDCRQLGLPAALEQGEVLLRAALESPQDGLRLKPCADTLLELSQAYLIARHQGGTELQEVIRDHECTLCAASTKLAPVEQIVTNLRYAGLFTFFETVREANADASKALENYAARTNRLLDYGQEALRLVPGALPVDAMLSFYRLMNYGAQDMLDSQSMQLSRTHAFVKLPPRLKSHVGDVWTAMQRGCRPAFLPDARGCQPIPLRPSAAVAATDGTISFAMHRARREAIKKPGAN